MTTKEIAQRIESDANCSRQYNHSYFDIAFEDLGKFLQKIQALDCFAAKIAQTVDGTMNPYGYQVARVSAKQAWCLACAATENGIEY